MKKENAPAQAGVRTGKLEKKRKYVELGATLGLLLVLAAMTAPFLEGLLGHDLMWAKWIYESKFNIPGWSLNIDNEVSVLSGLDKNENGEIFEPYYVRSGSPLIFTVQLPPETVAEVSLTYPSGQTEKVYSSDGKISLPAITKGVGQASVKAVSAESVDTLPADYTDAPLYDIDGRLIREKMSATELSSLERGLYVYGGKVIIVR